MNAKFRKNFIDSAVKEFTKVETPNGKFYTVVLQSVHSCHFLDDKELRIILALSAFADGFGSDTINQQRLARKTKISSLTTLRTKLNKLEEKFFIVMKDGSENVNGGVPLTYTLREFHSNPYILLSEAIDAVEPVAKKLFNVSTDNVVKKLDKIVRDKELCSSMIAEIPHSIEGYEVALKMVVQHIESEFEEERAQKEEKTSNVVRFKKKKIKSKGRKTTYTGSKSKSL